jgi:ribokinase
MSYILVIGSLNMDLVVKTERIPAAGETVKGISFSTIPGGKGANQAVAARRLGRMPVKLAGAIGADAFGAALKTALVEAGVDVDHVAEKSGMSTGTATIVVDQAGDNRIIIVPGANGQVLPGDVDRLEQVIAGAAILLLQFEIPLETIEQAVRTARRFSVPVMLNPAPAAPIPDPLLGGVRYLIVNETEAALLSGRSVTDPETAFPAAETLRARGPEYVVVTLGDRGALVVGAGTHFHHPARPVPVVDTTAAGDSFVGALAVGCAEGLEVEAAVPIAVAAGTLAVTRFGAQPSIPTREEVENFIS